MRWKSSQFSRKYLSLPMSLKKKTFLDVLLIRTRNNIETTVYRKPTTVDI